MNLGQISVHTFGFLIEQALGHITHGQNLQKFIEQDPSVSSAWGLIPYEAEGWAGRIPVFNNNWTVRAGLRTRRALAKMQRDNLAKPDALFFHTQVTATMAQDWLARVPSIISLDATPLQFDRLGEFYNHQPGPGWVELQKWRINRDSYRKARRLVAWSQWAKTGLVEEYEVPAEKVTVIHPGVDLQLWSRRAPYPSEKQPLRVLFVGGNFERKGGLHLLHAFRTLREEGIPIELLLVTRDLLPPETGVRVYHDMQPNTPELAALYHQSHLLCLPTSGDCLPMVLSEAAAAGLPAISTSVAAIPEVVRDEETGLIVPPGDPAALLAALRRLALDPGMRARMSAAAENFACRALNARVNASRIVDLMKQISEENKETRRR